MYERHIIGKEGEDIATQFLLKQNYKIVERNFECKQGEIDIIAIDKNEVVFVEVKTRTSEKYGKPADAVNENKKKHFVRAIKYYIYKNKLENAFIRIDVMEIYIRDNKYYINHIKKAID